MFDLTKYISKVRLHPSLFIVLGIVLIGVFLRFYRIYDYVTFLGDQGRDVLVFHDILTLRHLPAIGAPTSIGQIYLGPFYYYFIAPWLLLSWWNPIGPAVGVAVFSSILCMVTYLVVSKHVSREAGMIALIISSVSYPLVWLSRFSWNPNLLPFFVLLFLYAFYESMQRKHIVWWICSGVLFSILIQLHYIMLLFGLPIVVSWILQNVWNRTTVKRAVQQIAFFGIGFTTLSIPLIIFDLRHNFLNSNNFIKLFTGSGSIGGSKVQAIFDTFYDFHTFAVSYSLPFVVTAVVCLIIFIGTIFVIFRVRTFTFLSLTALFLVLTFLGMGLYNGPHHLHYFAGFYQMYYIVLAGVMALLIKKSKPLGWLLAGIVLFSIVITSYGKYEFIHAEAPRQIQFAQEVATIIKNNNHAEKYNLTGLPDLYSDSTYRYFLTIWGKRPLPKDTIIRSDELFVICDSSCKPIGDPQWDIAFFAPTKIAATWKIRHATLYKLVR